MNNKKPYRAATRRSGMRVPITKQEQAMGNIYWHFCNVKGAVLIGLWLIYGAVAAAELGKGVPNEANEMQAEAASQLWLTTGFRSYHFKRSAAYNENNSGIGFEWRFDAERRISGGIYDNSVRETTHYLHYVWTPLHLGVVHIGGAAGLIDGYPELNKGKPAFSLIPVATLDFKIFSHDVGLNLVYIPTIAKQVDGSLALQFKVRLK
jgi:hypothetical protein